MTRSINIGVTYTGTEEKHRNYVSWLQAAAGAIEVIRLSADLNNLHELDRLDGVVLSGGIDLHPRYYGNQGVSYPHAPAQFDEARDAFEKAVFERSQQLRIPVLGICRGMQLVNCLLGGSLIQDIGENANGAHRFEQGDKVHTINVEPGTLLEELLQRPIAATNSAHHQCIDQPADLLRINAWSQDGVVEGMEWARSEDHSFYLGVQWHPERMDKSGMGEEPASIAIRDAFIAAATLYYQRKQKTHTN